MKPLKVASIACVALAATAFAAAPGIRLRLATFGKGAEARWINQGHGDHAMYLAKFVPTSTFEVAGADVSNIEGRLAGDLDYLAWTVEERTLGASVRWNIYTGPADSGWTHVTFLGEVQVGEDGQISEAEIEAALIANGVSLTDEIKYLQIIMDEEGSVTVDDIAITLDGVTFVFGGPGNSG